MHLYILFSFAYTHYTQGFGSRSMNHKDQKYWSLIMIGECGFHLRHVLRGKIHICWVINAQNDLWSQAHAIYIYSHAYIGQMFTSTRSANIDMKIRPNTQWKFCFHSKKVQNRDRETSNVTIWIIHLVSW